MSDNNRFGVGGNVKVTEKITIGGEISEGDGGLGARLSADYHYSDRTQYYLAYELTDRTTTGSSTAKSGGTVTFGGKSRYTDALSVYGEERIAAHKGTSVTGLTHVCGRPTKCKQFFRQIWQCDQVLTCVRPLDAA